MWSETTATPGSGYPSNDAMVSYRTAATAVVVCGTQEKKQRVANADMAIASLANFKEVVAG